jgi:hypothetical protein
MPEVTGAAGGPLPHPAERSCREQGENGPRECSKFVIGEVFGADPGSVGDRSWVNPIARHALSDPAIPIAPAAAKPAFAFVGGCRV